MQLYITFSHLLLEDSVRKKTPKLKINGKTVKKVYSFVVTVHLTSRASKDSNTIFVSLYYEQRERE